MSAMTYSSTKVVSPHFKKQNGSKGSEFDDPSQDESFVQSMWGEFKICNATKEESDEGECFNEWFPV